MRFMVHTRRLMAGSTSAAAIVAALGILASACGGQAPAALASAELRDPAVCQGCHPAQFAAWAKSMHAYAADDPVFVAMNQRGQRETGGALGTFCVTCHAPMAVRDGLTQNGTNLAGLPAAEKGVTCFFCHSTESVDGTHNNPLTLATDGTLFGPFSDPVASPPHKAAYSPLLDDGRTESATACGTCHDIVNAHGLALERTFQEWQETLFAVPPHGISCAGCHMAGSDGPASSVSTKVRRLHDHGFPAVDVALGPFPLLGPDDPAAQTRDVQAMLDTTIQGTLCYDDAVQKITVALDNVGAGHAFPSGAAQDRRLWTNIAAYAGTDLLYQSGVGAGEAIEAAADPDLWLIRDCVYDEVGAPVQMFWQASSHEDNLIPGPIVATAQDPGSFTRSHLKYVLPTSAPLTRVPDRITLGVSLKAVGDDVLGSLVASGDLEPSVAAAVPTFQLGAGATLEWTRAAAMPYIDSGSGDRILCASAGTYTPISTVPSSTSNARCR